MERCSQKEESKERHNEGEMITQRTKENTKETQRGKKSEKEKKWKEGRAEEGPEIERKRGKLQRKEEIKFGCSHLFPIYDRIDKPCTASQH
jgi:hypothetical protein